MIKDAESSNRFDFYQQMQENIWVWLESEGAN